jgi:hypothetical protein
MPSLYHIANGGRERKHAKQICDRGAILPDRVSYLLLRQPELVNEALIALRLLKGIEVGALEILDERKREHGPVVELMNDGGNLCPAQTSNGSQPPLSCDELPAPAWLRAHRNGLKEPIGLDRRFEFRKLGFRKGAARLKSVGHYVGHRNSAKH